MRLSFHPCRPSLLCVAIMLVLAASAAAARSQSWREYRPAGAGYRIEMPGTPKVSPVPVSRNGEATTMIEAAVEVSGALYVATHAFYEPRVLIGKEPRQLLIDAMNGTAKGHMLRDNKEISVAGFPARDFIIEQKGNIIWVMRTAMRENCLYQIVVAMAGGTPDRPDTRRFIDSFDLVPR
ncbi:MAG: hypothetical protein JO055_01475 [Alphaproteobacteria bacterium]|nr:hypothetical protein [Alphaproteobacteria bacterium]